MIVEILKKSTRFSGPERNVYYVRYRYWWWPFWCDLVQTEPLSHYPQKYDSLEEARKDALERLGVGVSTEIVQSFTI